MKKILSLMIAIVLISGSFGVTPVFAAPSISLQLNTDGPRANFNDVVFAYVGTKVLFNTPEIPDGYSVRYFRGNTDITSEAQYDFVPGTVALSVVEGNNMFTARLYNGTKQVSTSKKVGVFGSTLEQYGTVKSGTYGLSNTTSDVKAYINSSNAEKAAIAKEALEYDEATETFGRTLVYKCAKDKVTQYIKREDIEVLELGAEIFLGTEIGSEPLNLFGYTQTTDGTKNTEVASSANYDAFQILSGSTDFAINGMPTGHSLSTRQWHTIKCYYDAVTNRIDYYIDGVLVGKNIDPGFSLTQKGYVLTTVNSYSADDNNTSKVLFANPSYTTYRHVNGVLGDFDNEAEEEGEEILNSYKGENLSTPVESGTVVPEGGTLVIDCEDMNIINPDVVSVRNSDFAIGGTYLHSYSSKSNTSTVPNPDVQYTVHFDDPGIYNIWMRVGTYATAGSTYDSTAFYYSVNGGQTYSRCNVYQEGEPFVWKKLTTTRAVNDGKLDICLAYRNRNIAYDRIVITSDMAYNPVNKNDLPNGDTTVLHPLPDITPPADHPRLYVTKDSVAKLKANAARPELSAHISRLRLLCDTYLSNSACTLDINVTPNVTHTSVGHFVYSLRARSVIYLIGEADEAFARDTIKYAKLLLATVRWDGFGSNKTRIIGNLMQAISIVYDYHYDLLTEEDKQFIISKLKQWALNKEMGYPPTGSAVVGHTQECEIYRDLLCFGAAVYGDDNEVWNIAAGKMFSKMLPGKRFFSQSGNHQAGTKYASGVRTEHEVLAALLLKSWGVSVDEYFGEDFDKIPLRFIYSRLPYGQLINEGDGSPGLTPEWEHLSFMVDIGKDLHSDSEYAPVYFGEWVKNRASADTAGADDAFWSLITWSMYHDEESQIPYEIDFGDDLPLTYAAKFPLSQMYARTNWNLGKDSDTAIAYMQAREVIAETKAKPDIGSFQIYYKGYLTKMNSYPGGNGFLTTAIDRNYNRRTAAHSCMTVYDPEEMFFANYYYYDKAWTVLSNDGGQNTDRWFKETRTLDLLTVEDIIDVGTVAETKGVYIGPNEKTPEFSYIKTDLTDAYGGRRINKTTGKTLKQDLIAKGYTATPEEQLPVDVMNPTYFEQYETQPKLSDYKRSMVFMDLNNETYPAAFICFDKIDSTDASFEKNWLLQFPAKPVVSGNTTTVTNTYDNNNGKMVVKTLLPESPDIEIIGGSGKEAWVDGANYTSAGNIQGGDEAGEEIEDETNTATEQTYGWRIEVSPPSAAKADLFLNAMYVTDADSTAAELPMTKVEIDKFIGVTLLDRFVLFSKTSTPEADAFTVTVPDNNNGAIMSTLITDIAPGMWAVASSNSTTRYYEVGEDENALYFKGLPGSYTITPASGVTATQISYSEMVKPKIGDFIIYTLDDSMFRNQAHPTKLINGEPYVCAADFYPYYGSTVTENSDGSVTITTPNSSGTNQILELTPNSTSYNYNGAAKTTTSAPQLIDGKLYVNPTKFTTEVPVISTSYIDYKKLLRVDVKYTIK